MTATALYSYCTDMRTAMFASNQGRGAATKLIDPNAKGAHSHSHSRTTILRVHMYLFLACYCCSTGLILVDAVTAALAFQTSHLRYGLDSGLGLGSGRSQSRIQPRNNMAGNDDNDGGAMPDGGLTSALARLDQNFQLQQRSQPSKTRWTTLVVEPESSDTESEPSNKKEEFVYLLEPPSATPSCLIVFTGGAGLGQFPHIAYSEFLMMLSSRLNAAVLTAPYQVGLDHFALAKTTGDLLRRAILQCERDNSSFAPPYPADLPTYSLSHSLGSKLQTIYAAATGQDFEGTGCISFNNFGFSQTIGMARTFASELGFTSGGVGGAQSPYPGQEEVVNTILNFAENAVSTIGVEFSPNPADMERLIDLKYTNNFRKKTRLFCFDNDTLDNGRNFYNICNNDSKDSGDDDDDYNDNNSIKDNDDDVTSKSSSPQVSALPGTHLTPVFFKFGLEDLPLDGQTKEMAADAIGGLKGASFGNEEDMNALVDEVCRWVMGKSPSREPFWVGSSWKGQRRITSES